MGSQPHQRTDRPWGYEPLRAQTDGSAARILHISRGQHPLLQCHREAEETISLQSAGMTPLIEDDGGELRRIQVSAGQAHHVVRFEACDGRVAPSVS